MVAMIAISFGVNSTANSAGFDKPGNIMYDALREHIYISNINKVSKTKENTVKIRRGSNEVRALVVPKIKKSIGIVAPSSITEGSTVDVRAFVKKRASRAGWTQMQWKCLDTIIYKESRWHPNSKNKHSSAYGLFQILKLPIGTPIRDQTERGISYIRSRYETPCNALKHHMRYNWY
jgi:hypothetical protein